MIGRPASVAGSAPGALDAGDMEARMVDMLDVVGEFRRAL